MLRIQNERMKDSYFPTTREYAVQYGLDLNRLNSVDKEIIITHPGPINRGVELNSDVIDSGKTVILDQVENGVAVRMAVMYLLAAKLCEQKLYKICIDDTYISKDSENQFSENFDNNIIVEFKNDNPKKYPKVFK